MIPESFDRKRVSFLRDGGRIQVMRILALFLALILGFVPVVHAYAATVGEAHCRLHWHVSDTRHQALNAEQHGDSHDHGMHHHAQDIVHQHAPGGGSERGIHAASLHLGVLPGDGAHCKCGCLCGLACAPGAAVSSLSAVTDLVPSRERWAVTAGSGHAISVHDFLLRPPSFLLS
jgi:hypothetical protein